LKYHLQWAKADCFDYAIVLASFLLGVGYDVFCVVGYAPRAITTNNQVSLHKYTQMDSCCPIHMTQKQGQNSGIEVQEMFMQ
jgi:hypothetical protein